MIIRNIEVCPHCGQWNPWRKVSSRVVQGRRRIYVRCKRCGCADTIEYRFAGVGGSNERKEAAIDKQIKGGFGRPFSPKRVAKILHEESGAD